MRGSELFGAAGWGGDGVGQFRQVAQRLLNRVADFAGGKIFLRAGEFTRVGVVQTHETFLQNAFAGIGTRGFAFEASMVGAIADWFAA